MPSWRSDHAVIGGPGNEETTGLIQLRCGPQAQPRRLSFTLSNGRSNVALDICSLWRGRMQCIRQSGCTEARESVTKRESTSERYILNSPARMEEQFKE